MYEAQAPLARTVYQEPGSPDYRRQMTTDLQWKKRIGSRIRELRDLKRWSLTELSRRTTLTDKTGKPIGGLAKSAISNYEQGLRLPGPEEAVTLARAFGESPAHILCLDDEMPGLTKDEASLIADLRALPEDQRASYVQRIHLLAQAYKVPVPPERVLETGYNPAHRPEIKPKTKAR